MLPDDALLAIFDFCAYQYGRRKEDIEVWQTLVHVCRRWRSLVFASPRRLNLRLVYAAKTPARDALDVWPALPLVIQCDPCRIGYMDNIVAVLERNNRVCQISLSGISSLDLEKCSVEMQVPFPELTQLVLKSEEKTVPVLPDSFLGGSAPRLRDIRLNGVPFPGLPNLLLSATHLVNLYLFNIPHSGYISPDAMVSVLSTLTSLESLELVFRSPRSCPDPASRRPPPSTRSVLSTLINFSFKGVSEYLEDLVACIDAPRLGSFRIIFSNDIVFDTPQLTQFISRIPTFKPLDRAEVSFGDGSAVIQISPTSYLIPWVSVRILCSGLDWQMSSVEQVCTSYLTPLFILETLYIFENCRSWPPEWNDNIENTQWLELLRPFTAVKNLYLSEEFARRIVPALQELNGGRTTEVLPALENIFLEGLEPSGPVHESIGQFVATRQVTGHLIAVSRWIPHTDYKAAFQGVGG